MQGFYKNCGWVGNQAPQPVPPFPPTHPTVCQPRTSLSTETRLVTATASHMQASQKGKTEEEGWFAKRDVCPLWPSNRYGPLHGLCAHDAHACTNIRGHVGPRWWTAGRIRYVGRWQVLPIAGPQCFPQEGEAWQERARRLTLSPLTIFHVFGGCAVLSFVVFFVRARAPAHARLVAILGCFCLTLSHRIITHQGLHFGRSRSTGALPKMVGAELTPSNDITLPAQPQPQLCYMPALLSWRQSCCAVRPHPHEESAACRVGFFGVQYRCLA